MGEGVRQVEVKEEAHSRCAEKKEERSFSSEMDSVNRNRTSLEAGTFRGSTLMMSLWK